MKKLLITASALAFMGVSAQAQMAFDGADITVEALFPQASGLNDVTKYGVTGRVAVSFGNIGVQADMGYDTLEGSGVPSNVYSWDAGVHTYYKFNSRIKAGAYYTSENINEFGSGNIATYGAEALIGFGKFDVELSVGASDELFTNAAIITADGFYQINDTLSINAGIWSLVETNGGSNTISIAKVGLEYSMSNAPLTFGVFYGAGFLNGDSANADSISASVSYSFGGKSDERLFGNRNIEFLDLILTVGG